MITISKHSMALAATVLCCTAAASAHHQARVYHPTHQRVAIVTRVVDRPVTVSRTTNRLTQSERLAMAVTYIKQHSALTAKQYSKITGLAKETAEAELDTFAARKNGRIAISLTDKKKVYVLR